MRPELAPCPPALGMSVDTSFAAVDHLTSSAETCDLITPVHFQESQGLCAHGNETEMGLKIPVCPGLSNTQCLSDIGLHSGNPVDPCGTFMGVEAFGLDSWICLRTQTHILLFFSNWYHCTLSTSYTRKRQAHNFMVTLLLNLLLSFHYSILSAPLTPT